MTSNESHAAGWALAAELCRWLPLRAYEYHPIGGHYDCLHLTTDGPEIDLPEADQRHAIGLHVPGHFAFDINRGGSVHIMASPAGQLTGLIPQEELIETYRSDEIPDLALRVLRSAHFVPHTPLPKYPEAVTVAVAAAVLRICDEDNAHWKIESVWRDDEEGVNIQRDFLSPFPEMAPITKTAWVILRDDLPYAWLAQGWLWTKHGERRDLTAERARGISVRNLARIATRPQPKGATAPNLDWTGRDPVL